MLWRARRLEQPIANGINGITALSFSSPDPNPGIVLQIVCGMKNDFGTLFKAICNFRFRCVLMSDVDWTEPSPLIFNYEYVPGLSDTKERTYGNLQDPWALPNGDSRIHSVSVPETVR